MLGVFFLLVWISVIAALTSTERQRARGRLLLGGQVDEELQAAMQRNDHQALVRYYRQALSQRPPSVDEQLIRINLACALNGLGCYEHALEELDLVVLRHLPPHQVALWLNNRAYTLALLGRPADALSDLGDAEDLLSGDDELMRDPSLLACISGTRGIALYRQGQHEPAERALEMALQLERVAAQRDGEEPNPGRTAERWWWLSEIARARGDGEEARVRLARAAAHPLTEFGARARRALAPAPPAQLPAPEPIGLLQ